MKQVILVNEELQLPRGKLAAQVAHAAVAAFLDATPEAQRRWLEDGMPKVVLRCESETELLALEAQIESLCLQGRVHLPGNCDALETWYPRLDAFVLPSLTEGMPLTILEALACGTPVIATAVGSVPSVLADLPGCRIVAPDDPAALVAAMSELRPRSAASLPLRGERCRR